MSESSTSPVLTKPIFWFLACVVSFDRPDICAITGWTRAQVDQAFLDFALDRNRDLYWPSGWTNAQVRLAAITAQLGIAVDWSQLPRPYYVSPQLQTWVWQHAKTGTVPWERINELRVPAPAPLSRPGI